MSSVKCPECGLVNFASTSECKRCHLKFHRPEPVVETSPAVAGEAPPVSDRPPVDANPTTASSPQRSAADNRKASPSLSPEYSYEKPKGLNAPMILFAVYLLLSVAALLFQFRQIFTLSHTPVWRHLTDPNDMLYIPGFALTFYASWLLHVLGILASLLLLIPLLLRWHSFLKLVRVYLVAGLIYFVVETTSGLGLRYALMQRLPIDSQTGPMLDSMYWASILRIIGFLVTFIWFRYFTTSDRVKRTFIK